MFPLLAQRAASKERGERPGALLARRTRTFRKCSFDARSKGQPGHSPKEGHRKIEDWKALARVNGTSRRASGWEGEKVARSWKLSPRRFKCEWGRKDSNGKPLVQRTCSLGRIVRGKVATRVTDGGDRALRDEDRACLQFWCGGCGACGHGPPHQSICAALLS